MAQQSEDALHMASYHGGRVSVAECRASIDGLAQILFIFSFFLDICASSKASGLRSLRVIILEINRILFAFPVSGFLPDSICAVQVN